METALTRHARLLRLWITIDLAAFKHTSKAHPAACTPAARVVYRLTSARYLQRASFTAAPAPPRASAQPALSQLPWDAIDAPHY